MEMVQKTIQELTVDEREQVFDNIADALEGSSKEAMVEGNHQFAAMSANMAQAIRINAGELARDDSEVAEQVLAQAAEVLARFQADHPYRMISTAIH